MPVSKEQAMEIGRKVGLNWHKIDPEQFRMGLEIEQEHTGLKGGNTIVAKNMVDVGKVTLAHLLEIPDYYTRLKRMEDEAKKDILKKACGNLRNITRSLRKGNLEGSGEIPPEIERKIIDFVRTHDNLDDSDFHRFAEGLGINPHEAEEVIYRAFRNQQT